MFACRGACAPRDPVADTVKVNMPSVINEQVEETPHNIEEKFEEEARQRDEEYARQQEQRRQEQEAERLRLEEKVLREREEAEERKRRELEAEEEKQQRELEEAAERSRAEAAQRAEAERLAQEEERKALVAAFLKEHGYSGVGIPKKTMLKTKYPIHTAAKTGDPKIVAALIEEGANPTQKNSVGQTAAQVAQQKNKKGSHANVLLTLGGA